MKYDKIRNFCKYFRMITGLALIVTALIISEPLFYLGVIPLLAGLINFCPLCIITKKCSI